MTNAEFAASIGKEIKTMDIPKEYVTEDILSEDKTALFIEGFGLLDIVGQTPEGIIVEFID